MGGNPVAGGGYGVVLDGNQGGKYLEADSEGMCLTSREAAGNREPRARDGIELIENPVGKFCYIGG